MTSLRSHRSPLGRVGLHVARALALSGALAGLAWLVAADVLAEEPEEAPVEALAEANADVVGFITLVARPFVPDAVAAALPEPPGLEAMREEAPRKRRPSKKMKLGRFEGY